MSPEQARNWARSWQEAGAILETIRHQELRELTPAAALRAAYLLNSGALPSVLPERRLSSSGLVEQQALLQRSLRP